MITVTVTEIQSNFEKYLKATQHGQDVSITENGIEVARLIPSKMKGGVSETLVGVLSSDMYERKAREERMARYENSPESNEDELDIKAYEKAMDEYKKNPVSFSLEEVIRMLEEDN